MSALSAFLETLVQPAIAGGLWLLLFGLGTTALLTTTILTVSAGWQTAAWKAWLAAQPFGFSALVLGWLAGVSSVPVLGTVLPAAFTLVTGLVASAVTKETATRLFVAFVVPLVPTGLLIGSIAGATQRTMLVAQQEAAIFSHQARAALIERGAWLAQVEDGIRITRQALELPVADRPAVGLEWLIRPTLPGDGRDPGRQR